MGDLYISSTKFSFKDCLKSSKFRLGLVLFIFSLSLLFELPYVFYGSFGMLFQVGAILISVLALVLGTNLLAFKSVPYASLKKVLNFCTLILLGFSVVRGFNLDNHVLVDYNSKSEDFLYDSMSLEFASLTLDSSDDLVINVKHKSADEPTDFNRLGSLSPRFSGIYEKQTLQEFRPFTLYRGKASQGKVGDIKGKRTVYGWFGSTSTDFLIKFD